MLQTALTPHLDSKPETSIAGCRAPQLYARKGIPKAVSPKSTKSQDQGETSTQRVIAGESLGTGSGQPCSTAMCVYYINIHTYINKQITMCVYIHIYIHVYIIYMYSDRCTQKPLVYMGGEGGEAAGAQPYIYIYIRCRVTGPPPCLGRCRAILRVVRGHVGAVARGPRWAREAGAVRAVGAVSGGGERARRGAGRAASALSAVGKT